MWLVRTESSPLKPKRCVRGRGSRERQTPQIGSGTIGIGTSRGGALPKVVVVVVVVEAVVGGLLDPGKPRQGTIPSVQRRA